MPNDHPRCKSSHNVLKKGGKYTVTVKVFEEFGFRNDDPASPREKCHNFPGSLKIEDSISDRQSECHPNNPSCITGVTCDDCNDGFNPRYHIDAQLINFSNTPLIQGTLDIEEINNTANYELRAYPNPSSGIFNISTKGLTGKSIMQIVSVSGQILKSYIFDTA